MINFFDVIEWYTGLPRWLKFGFAFLLLGISAGASFAGLFWPWGWGVGLVLLFAAMIISDD